MNNQLLGFTDVKLFSVKPCHKIVDFLLILTPIFVFTAASDGGDIHILTNILTIKFSSCLVVQLWVCSVKRRGLSPQPWWAHALSTNMEEVRLPILTPWGVLVRKSNIQ